MKKSNTKTPIAFYIGLSVLFLVMVSFSLTSGLYARYLSRDSAENNARVAAFVFNVEKTEASSAFPDISDIQRPGDRMQYAFIITNGTGNRCSEVKQQYTVTVTVNGNMPLVCTLTQNGETAEHTAIGVLEAGVADAHAYTLTVEWPSDQNDAEFANGMTVGEVILTVASEQVD